MLPEIFFDEELLTLQVSGPEFESLNPPPKSLVGVEVHFVIFVCSEGKDRTRRAS